MALNTRFMIVERHPVAGRMAGQRDGVRGYGLQPQQPPAHLSPLPLQVRCLPTASSRLSPNARSWIDLAINRDWCAADKPGRLQAGRPAVWFGTVGSKAGAEATFSVALTAGSPEAKRG